MSLKFAASAALALAAGLCGAGAHAACYVVYAANGDVVYRSPLPPVDLSLVLHETVPAIAPGGKLVFWNGDYGCESELNRLPVAAAPAAAPAPAKARRARHRGPAA